MRVNKHKELEVWQKLKPGIFYIQNTIDEYHTAITAYFPTKDEAMKGLEKCSDWFNHDGTGTIYYQEFGVGGMRVKVYEKH